MKKVLVTGAAGYIGSVLVRQLLTKNYFVRGFDSLMFGGDSLVGLISNDNFEFVKGDIRNRDEVANAIAGMDYIVNLAAIVGDPACSKEPQLAEETNWNGAKNVFDIAAESANIQRFVFASTCSNYGKMPGDAFLNESSMLNPVSLYAELKVKFEQYLIGSTTRESFVPTALRFATVYGTSNRMRFDLTVNEFMRDVAMGKELLIYGENFWRPYCHVSDLAKSCVMVLESNTKLVDHEVFGVGDTNENYQKKMLAEEIMKIVPTASIKFVHKEEDPRDYRVDFSKIKEMLGFNVTRKVPDGLKEVHNIVAQKLIDDPYSTRYKNS